MSQTLSSSDKHIEKMSMIPGSEEVPVTLVKSGKIPRMQVFIAVLFMSSLTMDNILANLSLVKLIHNESYEN